MFSLILISALAAPPGPLDAFRANFACMKAEMDYQCCPGRLNIPLNKVWSESKREFSEAAEYPELKLLGHWACDGEVELYRFSSTEDVLREARKDRPHVEAGKMQFKKAFVPKAEILWDGKFIAEHDQGGSFLGEVEDRSTWETVNVVPAGELPAQLILWRGPFSWGFTDTFPRYINSGFPGVVPVRKRAVLSGHPVEAETYTLTPGDDTLVRFDVAYDPAIGYLPRMARLLTVNKREQTYITRTMYLAEARPCAAGGFVPTEWFSNDEGGDHFDARFPNFDVETLPYKPGEAPFGGMRFRATSFKDMSGPAAMTDLKGVYAVSAPGGWARVRKPSRLTLPEIKKIAGKLLTAPSVGGTPMPSLDVTELHAFDPAKAREWSFPWGPVLTIMALLAFAVVGLWRARRGNAAGLVLVGAILAADSGCGQVGTPVHKLNAAFKDQYLYTQPGARDTEMFLLVRNDGNRPLRLFKADGGCSCRRIDQSPLPRTLRPGATIGLSVHMSVPALSGPQNPWISFQTDQGVMGSGVPYFFLVSHQFEPDSISHTALQEGEKLSFDFTHRMIYRQEEAKPQVRLVFPREFDAREVSHHDGTVAAAPDFAYEDTTYHLSLSDPGFGLHKATVGLLGAGTGTITEVPIVWERVPFVSSVPGRVMLGDRPARFFLRCPDDSVELTRIRSRPNGVDAVLVSPREVRVSLSRNAEPIIDGSLEVETSSRAHAVLRVPVVRYSWPGSTGGGGAGSG